MNLVKQSKENKANQVINLIAQGIANTEISVKEAQKINFSQYVSYLDNYMELNKIQRKQVAETVNKSNPSLSIRSIQNNWAKLVTASENGLNLDKYFSFKAVEAANKAIKQDVAAIVDGVAEVVDTKVEEQEIAEAGSTEAKNAAVKAIQNDKKFEAFLKYAKDQNFEIDHLIAAIKKAK